MIGVLQSSYLQSSFTKPKIHRSYYYARKKYISWWLLKNRSSPSARLPISSPIDYNRYIIEWQRGAISNQPWPRLLLFFFLNWRMLYADADCDGDVDHMVWCLMPDVERCMDSHDTNIYSACETTYIYPMLRSTSLWLLFFFFHDLY
jgi:hypothetical protein